jgi:pilus assembly protein Flp/PilA
MDWNVRLLSELVVDEEGQDLIEYALLSAFVALVAIAGASSLGTALNNWYGATATSVNTHAASAS